MGKKQRNYTLEFKKEVVALLESSGKSVPELSEEMGLSHKSVYRWRRQYGTKSRTDSGRSVAELEAELLKLKREMRVLRQERDILKKAISIVSQE